MKATTNYSFPLYKTLTPPTLFITHHKHKMAGLMKLSCVVFACMIVAGAITANAAESCNAVKRILKPCFPYLTQGGPLTSRCCNGVRNLNGKARTTSGRRQACRCIKSAAKFAGPHLNANRAAGIPMACRVIIPYKIRTSTNCDTYVNLSLIY